MGYEAVGDAKAADVVFISMICLEFQDGTAKSSDDGSVFNGNYIVE